MEGTQQPSLQSSDLLNKIREITRSIIEDLSNGRCPSIWIDRFRNYCSIPNGNCICSLDFSNGKEVLSLWRESHVHRLDVLLRVMVIVQKLLHEKKHCSKRDIYYMHPSIFSDQTVVDRAINDLCILLGCSRHNLNVAINLNVMLHTKRLKSGMLEKGPSLLCRCLLEKGMSLLPPICENKGCSRLPKFPLGDNAPVLELVMGWLRFTEAGRIFDCINDRNTGHPIPVYVENVQDIISVAEYILIVEKESVFQRLANDQFCNANRCIVITGRGYPDISTRRFLRLLIEKLHLPAFCLVDCDPYGFDILSVYRFGSVQMAYDAKFLSNPTISWLGAFPSDFEKYNLPSKCLLPLTAKDKTKTKAMLLRCYLQREVPEWRSELELMLQMEVKFEIEAFSIHSLSFLSREYIPSKIQELQAERQFDATSF